MVNHYISTRTELTKSDQRFLNAFFIFWGSIVFQATEQKEINLKRKTYFVLLERMSQLIYLMEIKKEISIVYLKLVNAYFKEYREYWMNRHVSPAKIISGKIVEFNSLSDEEYRVLVELCSRLYLYSYYGDNTDEILEFFQNRLPRNWHTRYFMFRTIGFSLLRLGVYNTKMLRDIK